MGAPGWHITYRVLFWVAHFHIQYMIQEPVNWFVFMEHQKKLYYQIQVNCLEHFTCTE